MRRAPIVAMAVLTAAGISPWLADNSQAQVSVNIGVAPECPYGYYDVAPYACAPAGYYGPEWFSGGVFVGAGPGFTVQPPFTARSITTSTRNEAITARLRRAERKPIRRSGSMQLTSKATRIGTGGATRPKGGTRTPAAVGRLL
jgi:hypothetical protein